uniref:Eukaryotic translation initiation factor 1A X-linked a n=1 Tax=Sinocyclocheilus anshuiensis TaxID=1608454 RepID=A0A671ML76_9TELE
LPKILNIIDPKCLNCSVFIQELPFSCLVLEYAQVIKMLGNGRLEAMCFDGVWINTSDIILVGFRDYQDTKADVILKYNADEARSLKA